MDLSRHSKKSQIPAEQVDYEQPKHKEETDMNFKACSSKLISVTSI